MILEQNCPVGHSKVCTLAPDDESIIMAKVCPREKSTENSSNKELPHCSCLPTLLVEQAIEEGVSPLGKKYKSCVYLNYNLVFPSIDGLFLS